ncbi:uncharacterized protein B0I36DRAFT_334758 [Microdochium trichocladiopsis]|uniref:Uncharacterized protein n=1 Tax=Microdochium trichocladiopsis TaxID=1682393 RepID=A0A9P9BKS9_9PEZI|nr:uncharacterized protein B0I36DRAFT_334758 [Microdochium trichocladiopsis]KAH7021569.1 hypothetical protein B0I36DRAFT_334758 [Microdochium trichocladiopsis]
MRFTTLFAVGLSALALASPVAEPQDDIQDPSPLALEDRAYQPTYYVISCQVTASALKYRTCGSSTCPAVGQYTKGKVLPVHKVLRNEIPAWYHLKNGYYVSSQYCAVYGGSAT